MKIMKRVHLIFCCSYQCLIKEMRDFAKSLRIQGKEFTTKSPDDVIIVADNEWKFEDEYRFAANANEHREKFYGLLLHDYKTCGHFDLDPQLVAYLNTHIRKLA